MLCWTGRPWRYGDVYRSKPVVCIASVFKDVQSNRTDLYDFAARGFEPDDTDVVEGCVAFGWLTARDVRHVDQRR